jgi:hypothetical protein
MRTVSIRRESSKFPFSLARARVASVRNCQKSGGYLIAQITVSHADMLGVWVVHNVFDSFRVENRDPRFKDLSAFRRVLTITKGGGALLIVASIAPSRFPSRIG